MSCVFTFYIYCKFTFRVNSFFTDKREEDEDIENEERIESEGSGVTPLAPRPLDTDNTDANALRT